MRNDEIELVTQYKVGKEAKEYSVAVMAKKKSLGRQEFYAGYGVGLSLSFVFVINPKEYYLADYTASDGTVYHPTHIRYNNKLYPITRTYETSLYDMELTV